MLMLWDLVLGNQNNIISQILKKLDKKIVCWIERCKDEKEVFMENLRNKIWIRRRVVRQWFYLNVIQIVFFFFFFFL